MTHKSIVLSLCFALSIPALAQTANGGITQQMLQQFAAKEQATTANKALFNAIAANSINNLTRNQSNPAPVNPQFSVEAPKQNIHDQKQSGRCWMFSGLNVLRANFAKVHNDTLRVEFSHSYLFFYDQLEKANLMLQGVIDCADKPIDDTRVQFFFKNPINDGGTFCGVADLAEKYGLVPTSAQPETYSSDNTQLMSRLVSSKLREFGLELRDMVKQKKGQKAILQRKTAMLGTIYHMLCLTLGEPVKQFNYAFANKDGKTVTAERSYTPKEFYQTTVGHALNGTFVMLMNDPRRPYHKTYEVQFDRHTYDGHNWTYLNLPMEEISAIAIASLKDGHKMYSSYDVAKQLDKSKGYLDTNNYDYGSLFSTTFGMNKAQRISTFDSGSTHAMTLTAVDLDANGKPIRWKVENSWGSDYGANGYLIMSNRWFNEYMFRLVVNKKYVPGNIIKESQQKPVVVPPEDPLFQNED